MYPMNEWRVVMGWCDEGIYVFEKINETGCEGDEVIKWSLGGLTDDE